MNAQAHDVEWWTAVPRSLPIGYKFQSLKINGIEIDPVTMSIQGGLALQIWDAAARAFIRRLYGHHLPKRLRKRHA